MAASNDNKHVVKSPMELKGLSKYTSLVFNRFLERAIWTFCELGIPDLMAGYKSPITAFELSQLNGNNWNSEFLYRLLRVIADADIIKEINTNDDNDSNKEDNHPEQTVRYELTEDGLLLTSNHFTKARDMMRLELNPHIEKAISYFPEIIKHGYKYGNSFEQAFGSSIFEYMGKEENKDFATLFNNAMVAYSHYTISSITSIIDFSKFNKIVDIAGGIGTLLSLILEKYPTVHGILFDLEHVIENAKSIHPNEFQLKQIESNRYEFISGDMFKYETIPSANCYTLKFIIHDWNDEKSVEILKSIRNANKTEIGKTITVFIIEMIILSNKKDNWEVHVMDLEMLSSLGSKERNLNEYVSLLNKSDFHLKQLYKTEGVTAIIEAVTTI